LHLALTLILDLHFKEETFFLDFVLCFILVLWTSRFLEKEPIFTLRRRLCINLRLRPQTYNLHSTSILCNTTRILHKSLAMSSANTTLLCRTTTFLLQFHQILLDYRLFSYTSLSGITINIHFTPSKKRMRRRKNRDSTLHFTRELFCYTICYPYFSFDQIAYAKPESLCDNQQNSSYN